MTWPFGWRTIAERKNGNIKYTILENGGKKLFCVNGIIYSALDNRSYFTRTYHDYFLPMPLLYKKPRVLVIGLGTGTIPFRFSELYRDIDMHVAETDGTCIKLAEKFLPCRKKAFRTIRRDGAEVVAGASGRYDIIIEDAYAIGKLGQPHIPSVFLTEGFIESAERALSGDGILAVNYAINFFYLPIYMHKLRKHFKHVYCIRHLTFGNYIIICSKSYDKRQISAVVSGYFSVEGGERVASAFKSMH